VITIDSIGNTINTSFQEHTILWIIISGIIGGIITEVLKFVFENTIPERQRRKATRIAIQKYEQPIYQSAFDLSYTIDTISRNPSVLNDGDQRLDILYIFGCFFGWTQIFLNESFSEGIVIPQKLRSYRIRMAKYQYHLSELFNGISYYSFFDRNSLPEVVRNIAIPRDALNAIGELMIDQSDKTNDALNAIGELMKDQSDKTNDEYKKVINIIDFVNEYQESNDFKRWFIYFENFLKKDTYKSKSSAQWNMLALINIHIILFCYRRWVKVSILPSEWFPSNLKSVLSIISWFPNKIIKWLTTTRYLISLYRLDKSNFKEFIKYLKYERKQDTRFISIREDNIIIETDADHLRYKTSKITLGHSDILYDFLGQKGFKRSFAERLIAYLDKRFLNQNIFDPLIYRLRDMGYLAIITRYHEEDLSFLRKYILKKFISLDSLKDISKKSDSLGLSKKSDSLGLSKKSDSLKDILKESEDILKESEDILKESKGLKRDLIKAWNKQGLIYSNLIGLQSEEGPDHLNSYILNAKKCFEESLKYDEYDSETLVRKGLLHMEMEHEYKEAIENFEKALRYSTVYGYPYSCIDIWNLLGILYFQSKDYHKAIENFEKALEIDNQHELVSHNKTITLRKLNK
jgi:tetratricopeptide (TPR) repeat protein